MENVVLSIHLILALLLIGVVLLQRSEGGGLGMGGGGGGAISARGTATALTKLTWIFAIAFIITSLTLTILATRGSESGSVVDSLSGDVLPPADAEGSSNPDLTGDLTPPAAADAPATPPRADEPADAATDGTAPATTP
jgi:preprotein translocase subunit SecG